MVGGMAARLQVQRFVNSRASRQVITRDTSLTYDLECYVSFTVREPIIIYRFLKFLFLRRLYEHPRCLQLRVNVCTGYNLELNVDFKFA